MKFIFSIVIFLSSIPLFSQQAWAPYEKVLWIQPSTFKSEYKNPFLPSPYRIVVFQTNIQYGITDRLTADLTIGYGKISKISDYYPLAGMEYDNPTTTKQGLIDSRFGLRYKIFDEFESMHAWMPTISLRLGGIRKGDYDKRPQSLGDGANGVESNLYFAKDFDFYGFGTYGDVGYQKRENPVPANRLYSYSIYRKFLENFYLIGGFRGQTSVGGTSFADPAQNEPQVPIATSQNIPIDKLLLDDWLAKERPDWARKENFLKQEISIGYRDSFGNFYTLYYSKTIKGENTPLLETFGFLANFSFYL